jgi:predicted kinase
MDLAQANAPVLAGRVLNRWLSLSGDYGSLACWRWYLTYRALVRAKVLALRLEQLCPADSADAQTLTSQLERYCKQAQHSGCTSRPGTLLLTHGVSGSGKSHLASALCQRHGWLHLRSDGERLRLFGRWGFPTGVVRDGDAYAESITTELYQACLPAAAAVALRAGCHVVVDATFLKRSQRQRFQALAEQLGTAWLILSCPVSLDVARHRIAMRRSTGQDPSEAEEWVLLRQWDQQDPIGEEEASHTVVVTDLLETEAILKNRLPHLMNSR